MTSRAPTITRKKIDIVIKVLQQRTTTTMLGEFQTRYTPFQMLIATVMSARTRDSTTIPIANKLFQTYKTPNDFMQVHKAVLEKALYGIGFYKTKAKNIKALSQILIEKHQGIVPKTMDELLELPGCGRKTANCVLAYAFRIPSIPVDIHVHRISNRMGLVKTKNPEETEQALIKNIPKQYWLDINELFVTHGQTICLPRNPKCAICPIREYCEYGKNNFYDKTSLKVLPIHP